MNQIDLLLSPLREGRVTESNAVKIILGELRNTYGKSFRDIEALPEFSGIPLRTLHSIYSGKRDVPKHYCARFGIPAMKRVPAHLETYDPAAFALYRPAIETVKPITQRSPENRLPRAIAALPRPLYNALQEQAKREGVPMAGIVRRALRKELYPDFASVEFMELFGVDKE